jgi:tungstate transport system substrate-binding protein
MTGRTSPPIVLLVFSILVLILAACAPAPEESSSSIVETEEASSGSVPEVREIILATTTSTYDSGLLDELLPLFESQTGYIVKTVAVGTGKALKMGEDGNADVLLVHAPDAEMELMDSGSGAERLLVMHNDFVLVGPAEDLAGIKGMSDAAEALSKIQAEGAVFVSRGDDSGTHKKELSLWAKIGTKPEGDFYLESGQGMGSTLRIASEKSAYSMTDRATYLATRDDLNSEILVEGDPVLLNVYHVITVNPEKWPKINYDGAIAFANFLIMPETQATIGEFGVEKFGQPLFFPDADKTDADLGLE